MTDPNPIPPVPDLGLTSVDDALNRLHATYLPALNAILERVALDPQHGHFVRDFVAPLNRTAGYLLADLYGKPDPQTWFAAVAPGHYHSEAAAFDDLAATVAPAIRAVVQYLEATDTRPVNADGGTTYSAVIAWRVHPLWDNVGYLLADEWGFPSHRFSAGGGNKPG